MGIHYALKQVCGGLTIMSFALKHCVSMIEDLSFTQNELFVNPERHNNIRIPLHPLRPEERGF